MCTHDSDDTYKRMRIGPVKIHTIMEISLGQVTDKVDLCSTPGDSSKKFLYFRLNERTKLVEEGCRLIIEKVKALPGLENPVILLPEASTFVLGYLLKKSGFDVSYVRKKVYPDMARGEVISESCSPVTAKDKVLLYMEKDCQDFKGRHAVIVDSVCTTSNTLGACYRLLTRLRHPPSSIYGAIVLFTEGEESFDKIKIGDTILDLYSFGHLPLIHDA